MFKITLLDLLQQDIEDIKSLIKFDEYGMKKVEMKTLARGIIENLEDHLEDLIKLNNNEKKPIKKLKNHLNRR